MFQVNLVFFFKLRRGFTTAKISDQFKLIKMGGKIQAFGFWLVYILGIFKF